MTGAVLWAAKRHPPSDPLGPPSSRRAGRRIRVGYFSADFHDHATMHLGLRTLELHDRSQFETMAFSFGPDIRDPMRQRAEAAFDRFVDVRTASDLQIARIAREAQIDIAVDLKGYTEDSRPGIFALRAAPLQVSYLGYPGTMGAATMDYLIADRTIVPDESRLHYREKIIHLPDTYQANDGSRPPVNEPMPRHVAGLPPQGLVFCCFNACYKITPAVFDCWMRILRRVNGSVLWLIADNQTAVANLQVEARRRGVDAARLIFARRMPMRSHLARLCTADLFLDTLPICAHTLASDALWAGLPLLTRAGESFAGRVAASLLLAMGIPELIAYSEREYEDIACKLADNPDRLSNLRQRLAHQRMNGPVFDSARLARTLESAYTAILDRQDKGLTPDHLRVGPLDSALPRPGTTLA
jgi:predicted O-linked N-acetylglucosamine transferase (SPINDLY family)